MKRLLYFAALIVAIGSIGGHMFTAHAQTAQTLTPSQQAALEQQLEVAKATLANLQMQAGMVPAGDAGSATVAAQPATVAAPTSQPTVATTGGLSATQIAQFNNTLSNLATMLTQLNASLASNATLTPTQQVAVQNTLGGMQNTLVAMATTVNNAAAQNSRNANNASVSAAAPVATNVAPAQQPLAQNTPAAPAASTPSTQSAPATPATTQQSPTVAAQSTDNTQQTAQASSFWSFTKSHWPTIVIVLLVIAILAILFWPEKEAVRTVTTTPSVTNRPKAPAPGVTVSQTTVTASPTSSGHTTTHTTTTHTPATPVASAVAAPAHK